MHALCFWPLQQASDFLSYGGDYAEKNWQENHQLLFIKKISSITLSSLRGQALRGCPAVGRDYRLILLLLHHDIH